MHLALGLLPILLELLPLGRGEGNHAAMPVKEAQGETGNHLMDCLSVKSSNGILMPSPITRCVRRIVEFAKQAELDKCRIVGEWKTADLLESSDCLQRSATNQNT